jgi:KipI family sensor histidine kinase inhibitor
VRVSARIDWATTVLPRLLAAADSALLVELGDEVSDATSAAVLDLDARICARPPAGVVAVLPALCSVLIEYDPLRTTQKRLRHDIEALLAATPADTSRPQSRRHDIPVRYGGDDGPDLDAVARATGLDAATVVRLHTATEYSVAMLGNLPGLPYLVGLDARLEMPRRGDPRDAVPAGSVAVAGRLSVIYPVAGPGGWNLIGRTDTVLFDPLAAAPSLLAPGDTVRFIASSARVHASSGTNARQQHTGAPALRVLEPGLLTTVQDVGRPGCQRLGVPTGGALDSELLRLANLLAGNPAGAAALEVTHTGPLLEVAAPSARLAVAGACEVSRMARDGRLTPLGSWRSAVLRQGERLLVGRVQDGLRCVVAVEGGVAVEPVLGSRSTYLRGGFGGLDGRALRAGDLLPLDRAYAGHHPDVQLDAPTLRDAGLVESDNPTRLHVVAGPQDDAVDPDSLEALVTTELRVSPRSDRVGLRLDGLRLRHRPGRAEIISDGCAPGSIQVPAGGTPIALLADRGTTGGYPKIATVASVDLPRLARLRPGARLRLQGVTVEDAEALRRSREAVLAALAGELRAVPIG